MKFSDGQKMVVVFQVILLIGFFVLLAEARGSLDQIEEISRKVQWVEVDLDMIRLRTDQSLSLTKLELIKEIEAEIKNEVTDNASCFILPHTTSTTL